MTLFPLILSALLSAYARRMGHKPWDMWWRRAERRSGKQAWRNEAGEEARSYGVDVTDDFDTIAEATLLDDGTMHLDAVVLDKRP